MIQTTMQPRSIGIPDACSKTLKVGVDVLRCLNANFLTISLGPALACLFPLIVVADGSKTYKVTLPPNIPAARFWSFTVYDNQSRSTLETPQRYPRAGSQTYPSPAAKPNADGSTTVYFGPTQPAGVERGNWIQTDPKKGWWTILRLYSPLASFFDKTWRPGEIELVK